MRPVSRFRHSSTRDLYLYWDEKRKGERCLNREDLEPSEIRHILPDIFILDVDDIDGAQFRIAGSRVCAVTCRELQGQKFAKDWEGEAHDKIFAGIQAICNSGAICIVTFYGIVAGDHRQEFEMVLLPMRSNGSTRINRVVGAMAAMETPYWLGMKPLIARDIQNVRVLWPTTNAPQMTETNQRSVISLQAALWQSTKILRRAKHLTLIEGGKA